MTRTLFALAVAAGVAVTATAADKPKMPDLTAKEWKKLDNGIKTWDSKEGSGEAVKAGDTVTIHYTLWLTDGTFIQSSKEGRGEPFTSPLKNLIKGWQEAVPGMKPGGVRRLVIPPELAYGKQDKGDIPPNSTLVFEIELPAKK